MGLLSGIITALKMSQGGEEQTSTQRPTIDPSVLSSLGSLAAPQESPATRDITIRQDADFSDFTVDLTGIGAIMTRMRNEISTNVGDVGLNDRINQVMTYLYGVKTTVALHSEKIEELTEAISANTKQKEKSEIKEERRNKEAAREKFGNLDMLKLLGGGALAATGMVAVKSGMFNNIGQAISAAVTGGLAYLVNKYQDSPIVNLVQGLVEENANDKFRGAVWGGAKLTQIAKVAKVGEKSQMIMSKLKASTIWSGFSAAKVAIMTFMEKFKRFTGLIKTVFGAFGKVKSVLLGGLDRLFLGIPGLAGKLLKKIPIINLFTLFDSLIRIGKLAWTYFMSDDESPGAFRSAVKEEVNSILKVYGLTSWMMTMGAAAGTFALPGFGTMGGAIVGLLASIVYGDKLWTMVGADELVNTIVDCMFEGSLEPLGQFAIRTFKKFDNMLGDWLKSMGLGDGRTESGGDEDPLGVNTNFDEKPMTFNEERTGQMSTEQMMAKVGVTRNSQVHQVSGGEQKFGPNVEQMNPEGVNTAMFIRMMETGTATSGGFSKKPYWDHKGYSFGFGHLIKEHEVEQGYIDLGNGETIPIVGNQGKDSEINQDQAKALLRKDLAIYTAQAKSVLGASAWGTLSPNQKAALTSYTYNAGAGNFQKLVEKGLRGHILSRNWLAAAHMIQFNGVTHASGKLEPGLVTRRKKEAILFLEKGMRFEDTERAKRYITDVTPTAKQKDSNVIVISQAPKSNQPPQREWGSVTSQDTDTNPNFNTQDSFTAA